MFFERKRRASRALRWASSSSTTQTAGFGAHGVGGSPGRVTSRYGDFRNGEAENASLRACFSTHSRPPKCAPRRGASRWPDRAPFPGASSKRADRRGDRSRPRKVRDPGRSPPRPRKPDRASQRAWRAGGPDQPSRRRSSGSSNKRTIRCRFSAGVSCIASIALRIRFNDHLVQRNQVAPHIERLRQELDAELDAGVSERLGEQLHRSAEPRSSRSTRSRCIGGKSIAQSRSRRTRFPA